jgi:branched-chain amino acid transport system substrate-binding protein
MKSGYPLVERSIMSLCVLTVAGVAVALHVGAARADEVRIGVIGAMSGDAAGYGTNLREAVDLVVKQQNEDGGILGQQVVANYCDDAGKPEQAVSCAQRLTTRENVAIILGSSSSPTSFAISQVALQRETPQIVISGTAQKITKQGNPWVFRSATPDTRIASDLADFVHKKYPDLNKIGFIYVNDDFGKGGLDAFKAHAEPLGMKIVAAESYTRGDLDFTAQLSRIRGADAQILVDWSRYTEGALIAKQLQNIGLNLPRFASDGSSHPKFRELAGEAANGWHYATAFSAATADGIPAAKPLLAAINQAYSKDANYVHAQAWDAAHAALLAIKNAGSTKRDAIRDALKKVSFDSVRGRFSFDADGDPDLVTPIILVKDGKETDARGGR